MKRMHGTACGLDEAGRGALAGPIVAAAVILVCPGAHIALSAGVPLRDGKLLSSSQRSRLDAALRKSGSSVTVGYISARSINYHGIGWANREIFRRLIRSVSADRYIIDGNIKIGRILGKTGTITSVVDADATIDAVIFAGIAAKVARDALMHRLHVRHPEYDWSHNAGYGTRHHIESIRNHGATRHHRSLFVATALSHDYHG